MQEIESMKALVVQLSESTDPESEQYKAIEQVLGCIAHVEEQVQRLRKMMLILQPLSNAQ